MSPSNPVAKDALTGPCIQHQLVRICMLVNEPEKALDKLEAHRWREVIPEGNGRGSWRIAREERRLGLRRHPSACRSGESRAIWRLQETRIDDSNARPSRVLSLSCLLEATFEEFS